jgi:hypothetical protein
MAAGRTNNCASCVWYDWERSRAPNARMGPLTISIASPAVVTAPGSKRELNQPVVFATTGALPSGLLTQTAYFAIPVDDDNFEVAATPGGAAIATSGTQSGEHRASVAVLGCHYEAPESRNAPLSFQPVDPDNWCSNWSNIDPAVPSQLPVVSGVAPTQPDLTVAAEVMVGLGLVTGFSITPVKTGRIAAIISGTLTSSTANAQINITGRHGTGTVPGNGAPASGTLWATTQHYFTSTAKDVNGFTVIGGNANLALNVPVWFDVSVASPAGGNTTIDDVQSLLWEL